ncbi:hypothetical protein Salat_0138900 [Sesamum alatum]|uniref:Disease resistance RPP13-like protein 1 n=1 Tax=Sesamum alatum TaxID=300844 RepID=A0AAE2CXF5_9LAMI|nr:hypothetical protein Salat_0138900 [Sesamum alatum]
MQRFTLSCKSFLEASCASRKRRRIWLHVQNSDLWGLRDFRTGVFPALLVSYLHLPPYLKHCFVFCSIFPKNQEFERKTVIHMWMAHGFILSDGQSKALEDIGNEYFNELLWMSVFEEIKECEGGPVRGYKMNETFYNLARFMGGEEMLVLNLLGCYNLKVLPPLSRITGLRHLDISGCEALTEIPYGIRNLVYLQTLPIYIVPKILPRFRVRDLRFKNLQLNIQTDASHFLERVELGSLYELQHLDLRSELKIKHLERVRDVEEAKAANLMSKAHLSSLGLCWGQEGSDFIMNPALGADAARFQEQKPLLPGPSDPEEPEACATTSDLHFAGRNYGKPPAA